MYASLSLAFIAAALSACISATPISQLDNSTLLSRGFSSGHTKDNVYYECYTSGACHGDGMHNDLVDLANRILDQQSRDYVGKSREQVIDCAGGNDLCFWVGDTHGYMYTRDDMRVAAKTLMAQCGQCGSAAFSSDPNKGLLQINKPCKCSADGGHCSPGQNWVQSTSC